MILTEPVSDTLWNTLQWQPRCCDELHKEVADEYYTFPSLPVDLSISVMARGQWLVRVSRKKEDEKGRVNYSLQMSGEQETRRRCVKAPGSSSSSCVLQG